jgi:hypothetical protein
MEKKFKVKCIDNSSWIDGKPLELTIGKTYDAEIYDDDRNGECYLISLTDTNNIGAFFKHRFINIKEQRKLKLKKLKYEK